MAYILLQHIFLLYIFANAPAGCKQNTVVVPRFFLWNSTSSSSSFNTFQYKPATIFLYISRAGLVRHYFSITSQYNYSKIQFAWFDFTKIFKKCHLEICVSCLVKNNEKIYPCMFHFWSDFFLSGGWLLYITFLNLFQDWRFGGWL